MNICNIGLLILVIVLLFVIYNKKSKENFTTEFQIIAENDQRYTANIFNIERWYKIDNETKDLGYSWKFKQDSKVEFNPTTSFTNDYTVSFLINFDNLSNNQAIFYGQESIVKYMELVLEDRRNLILKFTNERSSQSLTINYNFRLTDFYHIAIIYNKRNVTLFLDGQTKTINLDDAYKMDFIVIGKNSINSNHLDGYVGQFSIFKRALENVILCEKYNRCNLVSDSQTCQSSGSTCNFVASGETQQMCNEECLKVFGCDQTKCSQICSECKDPFQCSWIPVQPVCKFIPFGRSKLSCIKNCMKDKDCDYLNCDNICSNCEDEINCPWIIETKRQMNLNDEVTTDPTGKPSAPKISIMPKYKEVSITIESTYEGDFPIDKYFIFLYKTFNKEEGIYITNKKKQAETKETLTSIISLDPNEQYSIGVRAHNRKGVGKISKIETFKPNHKILQTEENNIDYLFDDNFNYSIDENLDFKFCNNK